MSNSVVKRRLRTGDLPFTKSCQTGKPRILIQDVSLVCDSPGASYEGDNAYKNSVTCRPGDHAKLAIDCTYPIS